MTRRLAAVLPVLLLLAACAGPDASSESPASGPPDVQPSAVERANPSDPAKVYVPRAAPRPEPRRSYVTIVALGLDEVPVVRYVGSPDDAEGTRIQNGGPMASPRGPGGGVGPGDVGNFIVTGHRTSHTKPFAGLPILRAGDRVHVRSGQTVFVYEVTRTRWTSFRSQQSLNKQSAAVPGRPGVGPVRPMITLSTCATPEDHAAGNYWSDEFGNPEHRIDKIGVMVRSYSSRS
jgi:sortase A